jgi:ABC-type transport system substrate-binding protein
MKLEVQSSKVKRSSKLKTPILKLCFGVCFGLWILTFAGLNFSFAIAKEYDGVWFLGFNLNAPLFGDENGKPVRQAVAMAVDRSKIAKKIVGDDVVPVGIIPPGMEGYDPALLPYPHDLAQAKALMRGAGYPLNDKRLKNISLLMTDGEKTKSIVDEIKIDLINIGFNITTTTVRYSNTKVWEKELMSGKYDMFVMGYKAGNIGEIFTADKSAMVFHTFNCFKNTTVEANLQYFDSYSDAINAGFTPDPVCKPEPEKQPTTLELVRPLFYNKGEANATHFHNKIMDSLLDQVRSLDEKHASARKDDFEEIGHIVWEDIPVVPLFYITKL